ncbi:MAG: CPBP family intramembrane metalloprotease [Ruminococcus sp.]|nr:CPBP family intramembrane metalloprotease [Ruminococcus sp.]
MLELKPKMFKESEKSTASENLISNIITFIFMFVIIAVAEAVIPYFIAKDELKEKLKETSLLDPAGQDKINFTQIIRVSSQVGIQPRILIPTLLCTAFGTIISILYCRMVEARHIRSMGAVKEKAVPHYLMGLLVGTVLMTVITLSSVLFGVNDIALCSNINFGLIGLYLLGFLVQGMSEEFIFRGYFMTTLGGKHNAYVAIAVSSAAFSLAHYMNPGYGVLVFINLALFGVFSALYIIYFEDIWGACAVHSIWNFTQGSFYGISVSGSGDTESIFRTTASSTSKLLTGGEFGIEGSIFTTVVLGIGIGTIIYMMYRRQNQGKTST